MKLFDQKVVLITGAGSGIGKRLSCHFASEGSVVILWDINKKAIDAVAKEIKKMNGKALAFQCDLSNRVKIYACAKKVKMKIGKVDILINNAGIVTGNNFLATDDAVLENGVKINLLAHFWTVKAFLPDMIKSGTGHIVTMASAAGQIGVAGLLDYCAAKFAVVGFDESLRVDLKKRGLNGIKTTCVCPYYINTGMFKGVKTRFSFLLPILDEEKTVKKIFMAIQKQKAIIKMPPIVYLIPIFRLIPASMMDWCAGILGINVSMDKFVGRMKK
jgi:all-trans-retinol dehydrogenase (NAD+)